MTDVDARRREAPMRVVQAMYRLVKACLLYPDTNQAVRVLVAPGAEAVESLCALHDTEAARLSFSGDMVFVNRRMLRAPRDTYALARELGTLVENCGANEIVLERGVPQTAVLALARLIAGAQRDRELASRALAQEIPKASLRNGEPPDADNAEAATSGFLRVVKNYAAATLLLEDATVDRAPELKRVAQKLVSMAEDWESVLVALAVAPHAAMGPARQRLASAVIAMAMARRLVSDRAVLTAITVAALIEPPSDPREALMALTRQGGIGAGALRRNSIVLHALAPGGAPVLAARLIDLARRFTAARAAAADAARDVAVALQRLGELDGELRDLLTAALGLIPTGTLVELDSGEIARVVEPPRLQIDFARPRVQLLTNPGHEPLPSPREVDLARPRRGEPLRVVRSVVVTGN